MHRSTITLLAAAAAAIAAIAVVALPAIGDSGTGDHAGAGRFAACLARHGLPGAPTTDLALKPWLVAQDPRAVRVATDACTPAGHGNARGPDPAALIACVRRHGLDVPTGPAAFKRWVGEQERAGRKALEDALAACKTALTRPGDPGTG